MTVQRPDHSIPSGSPGLSATPALMTADTLDGLRAELERLRRHSRSEIAQRLRDARAYGDGSNNDEHHAVREEQIVLEARLRSLEATIARAKVVDPRDVETGVAVIGSEVVLEDLDSGTLSEYRLGSAHETPRPDTISAGSPMGRALVGANPGTSVSVELPSGRTRRVRLVEVATAGTPRARTLEAA